MEPWGNALAAIRGKVSEQMFETWFAPIVATGMSQDRISLSVPSNFFKEWLTNNYLELIREALHLEIGRRLDVDIEVVSRAQPDGEPSAPEELAAAPNRRASALDSRLNPKYTFSNFVVGTSNQLPHAASIAIVERNASTYNPLFIYGGVGLGKTHLMHAIGNAVRARSANKIVMYISSEEFVNEFITSLRTNKMDVFRRKYRKWCDVLLVDDIQFIAGKDGTQDEFFHTFNSLYEDGKQIVLTSDKYPQEIPDLEERLRSRFQWGLIADIQAPELETRLAILNRKAEDERISLPDDVALYLASSIKTNVRELEGSLINLAAHASLEGRPIDLEFAKETLKRVIALHQSALSVETVQQAVCKHFNISIADIRGSRRHRSVALPRQVAMYLCRKGLKSSFPEIGQQFGGKDHTTALAACRKIERLLGEDNMVRAKIEAIERLLGF
jgi:chromosomal replication initiator protein